MNIEHFHALHGDDAEAKAIAWLSYGIEYLATRLRIMRTCYPLLNLLTTPMQML